MNIQLYWTKITPEQIETCNSITLSLLITWHLQKLKTLALFCSCLSCSARQFIQQCKKTNMDQIASCFVWFLQYVFCSTSESSALGAKMFKSSSYSDGVLILARYGLLDRSHLEIGKRHWMSRKSRNFGAFILKPVCFFFQIQEITLWLDFVYGTFHHHSPCCCCCVENGTRVTFSWLAVCCGPYQILVFRVKGPRRMLPRAPCLYAALYMFTSISAVYTPSTMICRQIPSGCWKVNRVNRAAPTRTKAFPCVTQNSPSWFVVSPAIHSRSRIDWKALRSLFEFWFPQIKWVDMSLIHL